MADGSAAAWPMKGGVLETGKGMLQTKQQFTDFQLHVEFATPVEVKGDSQQRGNSGVFLLGKFEIQVLDSFQNLTYPDGQAASMYGQYPPLVNVARAPGEWQTYDIFFTAPRFGVNGMLEKPAVVTVLHNGVLVQNGAAFWGPTRTRACCHTRPTWRRARLPCRTTAIPCATGISGFGPSRTMTRGRWWVVGDW